MPTSEHAEPRTHLSRCSTNPSNVDRLIEKCFRQLRYDSINGVISACRHAMQTLLSSSAFGRIRNYGYSQETPCGFRFSLFRNVRFEEMIFHEYRGVIVRVSYDCPTSLQGVRMERAPKLFEKGMLAALIGLDELSNSVHATFFEVFHRETTEGMKSKTGNHERGELLDLVV